MLKWKEMLTKVKRSIWIELFRLTGTDVDITRDDRSELIFRQTCVNLSVDFLAIVFGLEWRKHEIAIGQHLTQAGYISNSCAVATYPDYLRRWIAAGTAFDYGTG